MTDRELYEEGLLMDLEKAKDRIEELIAERDEAWRRAGHAEKMWGEAEVKLATCEKYRDAYAEFDRIGTQAVRDLDAKLSKAVIGLKDVIGVLDDPTGDEHVRDMRAATMIARTTIAELTGGKDAE